MLVGLTVGLVAYALLAAFTPEIHSDAVRQHLPWLVRSGRREQPLDLNSGRVRPASRGPCAVCRGVWPGRHDGSQAGPHPGGTLGHCRDRRRRLAGAAPLQATRVTAQRLAAICAAAIFATMPLVLWELGTAYVDLFPVLFAVGCLLAIGCWQRDGQLSWLLVAGALAGFGLAAKLTMGLVILAVVAALALVGRGPWQWRQRLLSLLAFAVGGLVVVPWLLRSYDVTGIVPGPGLLVDHAAGTATTDLATFGLGRSPLDLVSIPWHLTFHGEVFQQSGGNDVGIVILLLLPLALLAPRTRSLAFLAATLGLSCLAWAFTAQYTRYMVPMLALAAALTGIGVASVLTQRLSKRGGGSPWS